MEGISVSEGLAALGFWTFIAAIIVAGIWDGIRKREAQHETLRRMIESGQPSIRHFRTSYWTLRSAWIAI